MLSAGKLIRARKAFPPQREARVTTDKRNNLGKILKQRRGMIPLTLNKLAAESGVSVSHLGRIERGERFPSAHILRRIAKPLGFEESLLMTIAGFLSTQASTIESETGAGTVGLDPYVGRVLAEEPVEVQRTVILILTILKSVARAKE